MEYLLLYPLYGEYDVRKCRTLCYSAESVVTDLIYRVAVA
jgi:hypothetical protein